MQIRTNPRRHEIRGRQRLDTVQERALKAAAKKQKEQEAEQKEKTTKTETTPVAPAPPEHETTTRRVQHRVYRLFDRQSGQINNKTARKGGYGKGGWGPLTDTLDEESYYQEFYGERRPFQQNYYATFQHRGSRNAPITLDEYFKVRGIGYTSAHEAPTQETEQKPLTRRRSMRERRPSRTTLLVQGAGRSPTVEDMTGERDTHLPWRNGKTVQVEWAGHASKTAAEPWHGGVLDTQALQKVDV